MSAARLLADLDSARERKGWSKAQLAEAAGLQSSAVRRLFTAADQNPNLQTLEALADALGLEVVLTRSRKAQQ